jgi:hypothetical protein
MVKSLRFAVEWVGKVGGRPVVFARQLDPGNFRLRDRLSLAGHRVSGFDTPRALASDGSPRLDLFGFWLSSDPEPDIHAGTTVELTAASDEPGIPRRNTSERD